MEVSVVAAVTLLSCGKGDDGVVAGAGAGGGDAVTLLSFGGAAAVAVAGGVAVRAAARAALPLSQVALPANNRLFIRSERDEGAVVEVAAILLLAVVVVVLAGEAGGEAVADKSK